MINCSDIHATLDASTLESLIRTIVKKKAIDILFVGGDISDCHHKKGQINESSQSQSDLETYYKDTFFKGISNVFY